MPVIWRAATYRREKELLEHIGIEMFDTAQHISSRGPFLVAKEVLPAMRAKGAGSFFFSNNSKSLRGRKRNTGESLYYPRVMMRTLAQVLTEEYSEHGIHVANVVIDGLIDSPGTRSLEKAQKKRKLHSLSDADAALRCSVLKKALLLILVATKKGTKNKGFLYCWTVQEL